MLHSIPPSDGDRPTGRIEGDFVVLDGLVIGDTEVARRASDIGDAGGIGALGQELLDIGVAAYRATDADRELRRVQDAADRFETAVETSVDNAVDSVTKELTAFTTPESGTIAESVQRELATVLDGLGDAFDPSDKESILSRIENVIVQAGKNSADETAAKIRKLVDPASDDSPIGRLRRDIVRDLRGPLDDVAKTVTDVGKLIEIDRSVAVEAEKGTQKGTSYEDTVGAALNSCAVAVGDVVERTSDEPGHDGNSIGDYTLVAETGHTAVRIAWEVKDRKSFSRTAALEELDSAASNRDATVAVMVMARDTKLTNGAPLVKLAAGRYVVVYDKTTLDSLALRVTYQMVRLEAADSVRSVDDTVDIGAIADKVIETRKLLDKVSTIKRDLSSATTGIDRARDHVDDLRSLLESRLDELAVLVSKG